jgi:3'-phosphoadenosine 5'-phosphosulfate sulfotransferase (PAPS reductase)/FAD synthetase
MNPYKIDPPFVVQFSGGRTSGFMLRQILDAYNGKLPDNSLIVFCNTGLEHPETLKFVERVSIEWGVDIHWLEYRQKKTFERVSYATASRNGEPFALLIEDKLNYLPNVMVRFCTVEMKIKTSDRYCATFGFLESGYSEAIGLRADEPQRVRKIKGRDRDNAAVCPIHDAGHTLADVERFWAAQPFDLGIPSYLGNCVGCFLKGRNKLATIARESPESLQWWAEQETASGNRFRKDGPSYAMFLALAQRKGLFDDMPETDYLEVACHCTD